MARRRARCPRRTSGTRTAPTRRGRRGTSRTCRLRRCSPWLLWSGDGDGPATRRVRGVCRVRQRRRRRLGRAVRAARRAARRGVPRAAARSAARRRGAGRPRRRRVRGGAGRRGAVSGVRVLHCARAPPAVRRAVQRAGGGPRGPADLRRRSVCARTKCARIVPVPRGGAQMAEPNPGSDTEEMEFESDESEDMTVFISTAENGRTGTIAIELDEDPDVDMLVARVRHEQWTSLSLRMDPRMLLRYDAFFSAIAHHATLRDVHIDFLSVNTPQRMALSLRNSPLTSLTLERYRPAHENAVQLAAGLRGNHALRPLAIVDSILSADGAAAILGALAHNSTLEELRFLPRTVHGPEYALLAAVLSAPECAIANLSVRVLSAAAPGALAAGIAQNRSLRRVSLSIFTPAEDVMGAAARHPTITSLEVVSAGLPGRNPFVLPADSTLQHLSLTHFQCAPDKAAAFAAALRANRTLRTLEFTHPMNHGAGLGTVLGALAHNPTVQKLALVSETYVTRDVLDAVAAAVASPTCALVSLVLSVGNDAPDVRALPMALARNESLRYVRVLAHDITNDFADAPTWRELDQTIYHERVLAHTVTYDFAEALAWHATVVHAELGIVHGGPSEIARVAARLLASPTLERAAPPRGPPPRGRPPPPPPPGGPPPGPPRPGPPPRPPPPGRWRRLRCASRA